MRVLEFTCSIAEIMNSVTPYKSTKVHQAYNMMVTLYGVTIGMKPTSKHTEVSITCNESCSEQEHAHSMQMTDMSWFLSLASSVNTHTHHMTQQIRLKYTLG